jgi:hypothetical protein
MSSIQDFDCLIGQTIFDKYVVHKLIAAGNQGSVYEISKSENKSSKKMVMKVSSNYKAISNEVKILKEIRNYRKQNDIAASNVPAIICNGKFGLSSKTFENTEVSFFVMKKYDENLLEFITRN